VVTLRGNCTFKWKLDQSHPETHGSENISSKSGGGWVMRRTTKRLWTYPAR